MRLILPLVALVTLTFVLSLHAADLGTRKLVEAVRVEQPPIIDGKLDDACWQRAAATGEFWILKTSGQVQPTCFQAAYDSQNLYLAFTNFEDNPQAMKCDILTDDLTSIMGDEANEWFLQPENGGDYYQFAANCGGAKYDARAFDSAWNAQWQVAAGRTAGAWTLECAIAFASFGRYGVPGAVWGLQVCRDRQAGGDTQWTAWSPSPGGFHQPTQFGQLLFGGEGGGGIDRAALIECARAAVLSLDLERRLNEALRTIRTGKLPDLTADQRKQLGDQTAQGEAALTALRDLLKSDKPLDTRGWMATNARLQAALPPLEEAAWKVKFGVLLGD